MLRTRCGHIELNKRANEVFILERDEEIFDVSVDDDGTVRVYMTEDNELTPFDYIPDMTERPQALDYLLGKRDNFND